jgi:hypothetical protein
MVPPLVNLDVICKYPICLLNLYNGKGWTGSRKKMHLAGSIYRRTLYPVDTKEKNLLSL